MVLAISLSLNLAFACAGGAWLLKRVGGGASESPYYEAYTSVFSVAVPAHDVDVAFVGTP